MDFGGSIWKKTLLYKLLKDDPIFGKVVIAILILYTFIHIFRLEVYPLYMFAMFSKQEEPRTQYEAYSISQNGQKLDLTTLNYRKYTYLLNTISQYDGILKSELVHPETVVIDKFIDRLSLGNTSTGEYLKAPFTYEKQDLDREMGLWLNRFLDLGNSEYTINKEIYIWTDDQPRLESKSVLYEMD